MKAEDLQKLVTFVMPYGNIKGELLPIYQATILIGLPEKAFLIMS